MCACFVFFPRVRCAAPFLVRIHQLEFECPSCCRAPDTIAIIARDHVRPCVRCLSNNHHRVDRAIGWLQNEFDRHTRRGDLPIGFDDCSLLTEEVFCGGFEVFNVWQSAYFCFHIVLRWDFLTRKLYMIPDTLSSENGQVEKRVEKRRL